MRKCGVEDDGEDDDGYGEEAGGEWQDYGEEEIVHWLIRIN